MTTFAGCGSLLPDAIACAVLAVATVLTMGLALPAPRRGVEAFARQHPTVVVALLALVAFLLSLGYQAVYLRGAPRIIDATSYTLQARALATGQLAFDVPDPIGAFRGRFLVEATEGRALSVIFPPGYATVLAVGYLVRAPWLVGPTLAAGLVLATYALAWCATGRRSLALWAATLSVVCAALRYHTADTMSHGWAALLATLSLTCALRVDREAKRHDALWALGAMLAVGWLLATRPVTGAVVAVAVAARLLVAGRHTWWAVAGIAPGLLLLGAHQYATTGSFWQSTQLGYYAVADGPPGCFAYGFGPGIGCRYEHGAFVSEHLPYGYGLLESIGTTGRRLYHHASDILNFGPLAAFVLLGVILGWRERPLRLLAGVVLGVIVAYAPFYFDGSYPGGGARLFADVIPLEHVFAAVVIARWRTARFVVPITVGGFAFGAARDHRQLAEREGGRPMFEHAALVRAGVDHGIVFVSTDHGFNLGHDPAVRDALAGVLVARRRGDAHDYWLWDTQGRPPAYAYEYDPFTPGAQPQVRPYAPGTLDPARFEGEALWPVRSVQRGWAHPTHVGSACASGGQGLRLHPSASGAASLTVELFVPRAGRYELTSHWVAYDSGSTTVSLDCAGVTRQETRTASTHDCWSLPPVAGNLPRGRLAVKLGAAGTGAVLDRLDLRPAD